MSKQTLEKWKSAAYALEQPLPSLPAPLHVMTGEAVDVGWFCEHYWEPEIDSNGVVVRPGLVSAERPGTFEASIGKDVLELHEALQTANTEYLLTAQRGPDTPMDRAQFVLGELKAVLAYMADDGVDNVDDQRLVNFNAQHQDAASQDAVAAALDDYAGFAELHRAAIRGLGGFDAALVDEARALAKQLRERSAQKIVGVPPGEQRAALELRNRVATLLHERMNRVRAAARFVFRHDPDLVRRVTSAYQRQRRSAANRARASQQEQAAQGGPTTEGGLG